ncbi:MAG: DUF456 domain-containing protein [Oscillatoriales cyanobacterium]|uniref:Glycine zipper domain-containing protein n=1 Tax=Microcoleus anatoxicus PTRS2 TaxID=2705321 RepID=A0ABU8YHA0_9CYAN|nr:MAG: DUF456 domain-containing protein [Oscillatoriales cyanobacterium]TAD95182.1 MAG: DUF456 domain-containing protein [Oscillatoriales cyanobacterium]TAD99590.1 MAG: DUF456 domain-containing protein [Oscillatoriales cyanobacterium]
MESLSLIAINLVLWAFPSAAEVAVDELTESQNLTINQLHQRITDKLKENPKARSAIFAAEHGSKSDLEQVAVYLQVAMYEDAEFAAEMQAICQELGTIPDDKAEFAAEMQAICQELGTIPDDKRENKQQLIEKIGNQMIVGASGGALIGNMVVGVPGAVPGAVAGAVLGWWYGRNSRSSDRTEDSRDVK